LPPSAAADSVALHPGPSHLSPDPEPVKYNAAIDPAKFPSPDFSFHDAFKIKKHPFFKCINWAKLERREIESQYKPAVKCSLSVENFDKIWTDQKPEDSPACSPTAHAQTLFEGFSYVQPNYMHMADPKLLSLNLPKAVDAAPQGSGAAL
jgi:hypothetical protein